MPYLSFLDQAAETTRHWLFDHALPLWWAHGADHVQGGFHEKLDEDGAPVGRPLRVRVQARQVFVYARAGELGWTGPWRQAVRHGLDFMLAQHQRPDGFFRSAPATGNRSQDDEIDLYDQAFVLFALSHAWKAEGQPAELLAIARKLMAAMEAHCRLPDGGYRAKFMAGPAAPTTEALRQSNPLMHLLEALLAWEAAGMHEFRGHAVALCRLALDQLIDAETGALGENFSEGWQPVGSGAMRVNEPGHQFEWAWLLLQAQELLGADMPDMPDADSPAKRLEQFGRHHGVDPERGVAIFAVDGSGIALDRRARLWAQTERLRTSMLFAGRAANPAGRATFEAAAMDAFAALQKFLATPTPGLWHEWMDEQGHFESAPSPASTLYHLMTGFEALLAPRNPTELTDL